MELDTDILGSLVLVDTTYSYNDTKESTLEEYQESDFPSRSGDSRKKDRSYSYAIHKSRLLRLTNKHSFNVMGKHVGAFNPKSFSVRILATTALDRFSGRFVSCVHVRCS